MRGRTGKAVWCGRIAGKTDEVQLAKIIGQHGQIYQRMVLADPEEP